MKIERLALYHLKMPLVHFFETSFGRESEHETLIVRVDAGGATGWGECPAAGAPYFSGETTDSAAHIVEKFLAPRIGDVASPSQLPERFKQVRGNPMAKAGVEGALWDLWAKRAGKPLAKLWGGTRDEVDGGISLGIEDTLDDLLAAIGRAVEKRYKRVKIKIKHGWDIDVVLRVRKAFPDLALMVDANGAYRIGEIEHLRKLDGQRLMMIEQPFEPDALADHVELAKELLTPICLDESIGSPVEARGALDLGACQIINVKQARVGGFTRAKEIQEIAAGRGKPVWCGGLLESGIGRAHNMALATLGNFKLPGDLSESARFYAEDVIDPPVTLTERGTLAIPSKPGIGFEVREERLKRYTVASKEIRL